MTYDQQIQVPTQNTKNMKKEERKNTQIIKYIKKCLICGLSCDQHLWTSNSQSSWSRDWPKWPTAAQRAFAKATWLKKKEKKYKKNLRGFAEEN